MNMEYAEKYVPRNEKYIVEPADSLLDDVFGMRRTTLKRKLDLLKEQIGETQVNLEHNLAMIDLDLCKCSTIASNLPDCSSEAQNRIVLKYKLPLYREARQQRTECLRDTAMLRREFLDTTLQYLSLQDKETLLK